MTLLSHWWIKSRIGKDKGVTIELKSSQTTTKKKPIKTVKSTLMAPTHLFSEQLELKKIKGMLLHDTLQRHLFSGTENGKAKYKDVKSFQMEYYLST